MFTLHWSPRSPYVRKVMVALHEKGLSDQVRTVRTTVDPLVPLEDFLGVNPLSKIPTLERDGAPPIFDSRVIMEWADTTGRTGPRLFPAEPAERWQTLSLEAVGTGLLDVALSWLVEARMRPAELRYDVQIDVYRRKLNSVCDWLEPRIQAIAEKPFDAGHVAVGVALCYIDFRFDEENWRADHPRLAAWHKTFSQRPSVIATAFRDDPRPA